MDLTYSTEYEEFRAELKKFLADNWTDADRAAGPAPDSQAALMGAAIRTDERAMAFRLAAIERGYLYRSVPRRYGGGEPTPDPLKATGIAQEVPRSGAPGEGVGPGASMPVPTLLEPRTQGQKTFFHRDTL